jgi:N-(2-amino-2-carboxyethyl)-L-glutamate synthase
MHRAKPKDVSEISSGVLSAIGKTPLVRMEKIFNELPIFLYAKLEMLNPGGSIKDRPAFEILKHALETGEITPETVIVESSSGNMAIGLAQACCYFGLRFVCVADAKTTRHHVALLKAYGAEIEIVEQPDPTSGEYLPVRISRVQALLREIPFSYWPDQYSNLINAHSNRKTAAEITDALEKKVDWLVIATSTCGTLRGCAEYVREKRLATRILAVDAEGSVIFGGAPRPRLIPGHGASIRPALFKEELCSQYVLVSDFDCVVGCRRLVREEAILAGGSSGALISAVSRTAHLFHEGATVVVILPDRGERYVDTIYSDEWVLRHFGIAPDLDRYAAASR